MANSPNKIKIYGKQGISQLFCPSIKNPKNHRQQRRNIVGSVLRLHQSADSNKFQTLPQSPSLKLVEQHKCVESEYRHTNLRR